MARQPLLNVRLPQTTIDAVAALAEKEGRTTSAVVRELLELAVAAGGLGPFRRTSVELRLQHTGMPMGERLAAVCAHPTPAHKRHAFTVVCGLCGTVVKRTG